MNYYNTSDAHYGSLESHGNLKEYREKAKSQSIAIMAYIKYNQETYSNFQTTSSRLFKFLFLELCPITSVRRSVSDLVDAGVLEYGEKITGLYGRPESLIKLTNKSI